MRRITLAALAAITLAGGAMPATATAGGHYYGHRYNHCHHYNHYNHYNHHFFYSCR